MGIIAVHQGEMSRDRRPKNASYSPLGVIVLSFLMMCLLSGSGCAHIKPAPPPLGKALLKHNILAPAAHYATIFTVAKCPGGWTVCDVNGGSRPDELTRIIQAREEHSDGTLVAWNKAYVLIPGHQTIRVENDMKYCGDESRWLRWTAAAIGGALIAGPLGATALTAVTAAEEARTDRPPVILEIDAEAGKNYILYCDTGRSPWAWIVPEDQLVPLP